MEITLIRHGKSKCVENNPMNCKEFNDWIGRYDCKGVFEENAYPIETLKKITVANIVMTSDLKRSVKSAQLLNRTLTAMADPLFRETELPIPSTKLWGVKLNPSIWALILRCLWLCGYSKDCESLSKAKDRAKKASELLVEHAKEHTSVVLVGHGFFNRLISKELRKKGWKGKNKTSLKHWNSTTYSFFN